MKKNILFLGSLLLFAGTGMAATEAEPFIMPEAFAFRMSGNGINIMAQDLFGDALVFYGNVDDYDFYDEYYPGIGNCISDNGILVGQSMNDANAAIMKNGKTHTPRFLNSYTTSALEAVTRDGSRAAGWLSNTTSVGPLYLPFYCEISSDGTIDGPYYLPVPEKDFFGEIPQMCTASWINDDGTVIAGIVTDASGFYSYPIIYLEDENGDWTYSLPSEPLFNPDNLPIPVFPEDDHLTPPNIEDFMTPEKREEWQADMKEYEETGEDYLNPWNYLDYYLSNSEYALFVEAIMKYNEEVQEYYDRIDEYWQQMAKISYYVRFAPNIALSPQGNTLLAALGISSDVTTSDFIDRYVLYCFDLENGTCQELNSQYSNLIPNQVTEDGSLVAFSAPNELLPYRSFIKKPEAEDFMTFEQYLEEYNPECLPWVKENLMQNRIIGYDETTEEYIYGEVIISGVLSFGADMSSFVGGVRGDDNFSYCFMSEEASVNQLAEADENGLYRVYNLNGINVLTTRDKAAVSSLPKGLYIINGKKFLLK